MVRNGQAVRAHVFMIDDRLDILTQYDSTDEDRLDKPTWAFVALLVSFEDGRLLYFSCRYSYIIFYIKNNNCISV